LSAAVTQGTNSGNTGGMENSSGINPMPLFFSSPEERTIVAFAISAVVVFVIFIIYVLLKGSKFIKDENEYPSLAKFQLLIWTIIIAFGFFGIYLTRIFGGILIPPPTLSSNLLALMGMTVFVVPVLNKKASDYKYGSLKASSQMGVGTMLKENGNIELTRVQMFAWTLISVFIFLTVLYSTVITKMDDVQNLTLPDIDSNLVVLMGISQGAYLGAKSLLGRTIIGAVTAHITVAAATAGGNVNVPVTITGTNFGDAQGHVIYDTTQLNTITQWSTNRIDVTIPYAMATLGAHSIKIITKNRITEPFPFNLS